MRFPALSRRLFFWLLLVVFSAAWAVPEGTSVVSWSVAGSGQGSVAPLLPHTVDNGSSMGFRFIAAPGSVLDSVTLNGSRVTLIAVDSFFIRRINHDRHLTGWFTLDRVLYDTVVTKTSGQAQESFRSVVADYPDSVYRTITSVTTHDTVLTQIDSLRQGVLLGSISYTNVSAGVVSDTVFDTVIIPITTSSTITHSVGSSTASIHSVVSSFPDSIYLTVTTVTTRDTTFTWVDTIRLGGVIGSSSSFTVTISAEADTVLDTVIIPITTVSTMTHGIESSTASIRSVVVSFPDSIYRTVTTATTMDTTFTRVDTIRLGGVIGSSTTFTVAISAVSDTMLDTVISFVNSIPVFESTKIMATASAGVDTEVTVNAIDGDGDFLSYAAVSLDDARLIVTPSTDPGCFVLSGLDSGLVTLIVTVTDGAASSLCTLLVAVSPREGTGTCSQDPVARTGGCVFGVYPSIVSRDDGVVHLQLDNRDGGIDNAALTIYDGLGNVIFAASMVENSSTRYRADIRLVSRSGDVPAPGSYLARTLVRRADGTVVKLQVMFLLR